MTYMDSIHNYQYEGKNVLTFPIFTGKLSKFTSWKKLNASYVMSATDYLPRCKYKKNLANDVHCELYFLQKYGKNPNSSTLRPSFLSKNVGQTKKEVRGDFLR